jgi:hypothetical protein
VDWFFVHDLVGMEITVFSQFLIVIKSRFVDAS